MSKYIGNTTFFEVKYIFNGYPEHDGGWEYNKIHFQKTQNTPQNTLEYRFFLSENVYSTGILKMMVDGNTMKYISKNIQIHIKIH